MKCRYYNEIYRNTENGFCIFRYLTDESNCVPPAARDKRYKGKGIVFTAKGYYLPDTDVIECILHGKWEKSQYGYQLITESYEEIIPQTKEGITAYLSSGMIKGIGPKTAESIVEKFGTRTFEVLEQFPERLLDIKGITKKKLNIIINSYKETNSMKELAAYLLPFKVSQGKVIKIREAFGEKAMDMVRKSPFSLCEITGFGFLTVDEIAKANRTRLNDPLRIKACITYMMDQAKKDGHLFQETDILISQVYEQLNRKEKIKVVTKREISAVLYEMIQSGKFIPDGSAIYPMSCYEQEITTAEALAEMLLQEFEQVCIDQLLAEAQKELNITLSQKQSEAVKMVFQYGISIITGSPGTGKTTVQKVILYIYEKLGGKNAMLMAPTGRAGRRMAESTGFMDASTMHSALGLIGEEDDSMNSSEDLEADFIICDEISMVDMYLAKEFFTRVGVGTRVVLICDINQLPSVGPGNVAKELISSGIIPVTVLDMVFRQGEDSLIPINAELMLKNNAQLQYGSDFILLPAGSDKEAQDIITELYMQNVSKYGIDNVQVLTPFRKRGEASVNSLNAVLKSMLNPGRQKGITISGKTYHIGDKIIQNKNKNAINNGDSGFITDIFVDEDDREIVKINFTDNREVEYDTEDMEMIEHAYALTIHKAQGSEYPVVILPWISMFSIMLRRNILYTAITRGKTKVIIVGQKKAVFAAVHNTKNDNRNTRLRERLVRRYSELVKKNEDDNPQYEQMVINL